MRAWITIAITLVVILSTTDQALADKKEIERAVKSEYRLTKRSLLTGEATSPGTVIYVRREGLQGINPIAVIPETVVEGGEVVVPSGGPLPLPVGEQLHVYSIRTTKDSLRVLLGTVQPYEVEVMGSTAYKPYQVALKFRYPDGLQSVSTERALEDLQIFISKEPIAKSEQASGANTSDAQTVPTKQPATTNAPPRQHAGNEQGRSQSGTQSNGRSMRGLEPIGAIDKPGCEGIEVIGYAQDQFGTGQYYYYVAIRNNTNVTKLVGVRHIGGRTVHGRNREGSGDLTIRAGDIKKYEIDLSINPPVLFEVTRCL